MRRVLALLCFALAAVILAAAGLPDRARLSAFAIDGETVAPEIGGLAPLFTASTVTGGEVGVYALRGAVVIVNFWATWCAPCRDEMRELNTLYQTRRADGIRILAVNTGEPAAVASAWANTLQLRYDVLLDEANAIAALYRLRGMPSTYIIAPDGRIAHVLYGPTTAAALDALIAPYLNEG